MFTRCFFLYFLILSLSQGQCQVNLQTGAAQFSLPLYNYQDANNRIGCSISLNYVDGNGLKVNEIASSVGTGWSLQFGGDISRIQKGQPDDQPENGSWTNSVYFPNGYLYPDAQYPPGNWVTNGGAYVPIYPTKAELRMPKKFLIDREQDIFQFQFNGRTGEFLIGADGSIRTMQDSKLKIKKVHDAMSANIRTTISAFEITDEAGIKYIFRDRELSEVLKYDYGQGTSGEPVLATDIDPSNTCQDWFGCRYASVGRGIGQYVVSKWCLSEIINTLTNISIKLNYEDYSFETNGNINFQRSYANQHDSYSMSVTKIKGIGKRIKTIACSQKEKIEFAYNYLFPRYDLPGDYALENISIVYDEVIKSKWNFSLSYTGKNSIYPLTYTPGSIGSAGSERPYLRLCLLSVQKVGANNTTEPPYQFTYNLGTPGNSSDCIPARFSYYHDHWGYSNAAGYDEYGNESIPFVLYSANTYKNQLLNPMPWRQAVDKLAQNGILKSIKYPTGGSLAFEYEQRSAFFNGANTTMGGVRVKTSTSFDGLDHTNDITQAYKYVESNGNSSGWGYETLNYTLAPNMTLYKASDRSVAALNMSAVASSIPRFNTFFLNKFALDASGEQTHFLSAGETTLSAIGSIVASFAASYLVKTLFDVFSGSSQDYTSFNTYSDPVDGNNPLPFQYRRVEVSSSQAANNGKTVYEFTHPSDPDIPDLKIPEGIYHYTNKQRGAEWAYGLLRSVTEYDNHSNLKKATVNTYSSEFPEYFNPNYRSLSWRPERTIFRSYNDVIDLWNTTESDLIVNDVYYPFTGHIQLIQTDESLYNTNGVATTTSTEYKYNSDYQLNYVKKTNSKGEVLESKTYYPNDYTQLTGPVNDLRNNYIISVPVATQTFITKPDGKYLLNGSVNDFALVGNGDIKVVTNYRFESVLPVEESSVTFDNAKLVPNTTYYKPTTFFEYNSGGLPKLITSKTERAAAFYDYDNKLTTANIINASADDISYTSFEAENGGNWNYDQQYVVSDFSPTGTKCFRFPNIAKTISSTSIKGADFTSWSSPIPYTLSFWTKGGVPFVSRSIPMSPYFSTNGISLKKTYQNTATGWTYYEYEVNGVVDVSLGNERAPDGTMYSTPASFLIDEVRLYPANARLQTTTYDPLIGKTSECDQNGRITYYSYDGLGRLKMIRDENRNVLKAYEYNTASQ